MRAAARRCSDGAGCPAAPQTTRDAMATTTARHHYVYAFADGDKDQRELLGGKGANLAEMTRIGLPVPPGFIITTDACRDYLANDETLPEGLWGEVSEHLH